MVERQSGIQNGGSSMFPFRGSNKCGLATAWGCLPDRYLVPRMCCGMGEWETNTSVISGDASIATIRVPVWTAISIIGQRRGASQRWTRPEIRSLPDMDGDGVAQNVLLPGLGREAAEDELHRHTCMLHWRLILHDE
jgi:hypothetical protein